MNEKPKKVNGLVVINTSGERRVVATKTFEPGEIVFTLKGVVQKQPTKYTVQIGWGLHLSAPDEKTLDRGPTHYYWRFLNHHCTPNTFFRGTNLVALHHIEVGEEVTFNYNTTEYEMVAPFECWCDARPGRHVIRGFKYLSFEEQRQLRPYLIEYLKSSLLFRESLLSS